MFIYIYHEEREKKKFPTVSFDGSFSHALDPLGFRA